jgi:mannose-6-phosphate isomerase-like protein (cupin superfamily)
MSYTIKNLREVTDSAPKFGFAEKQEAHFAHEELDAETIGFSYLVIKPGKRMAFAHRHENAEEVYVVVGGSGRVKLDDDAKDVGRLDAIRVAPSVLRTFEAGDEGLELVVFGPKHEGDGELVFEDVWGDA